jgi:hypothetical protein
MNKLTKRVLLALSLLVAPAALAVTALQPSQQDCCCGDTCRCSAEGRASGDCCCCKDGVCPTR